MSEEKQDNEVEEVRILSNNQPTSHTNFINIAVSRDGGVLLQMLSMIPEDTIVENHRTFVSYDHVEEFIESLCELTGHYPKKPRKKRTKLK